MAILFSIQDYGKILDYNHHIKNATLNKHVNMILNEIKLSKTCGFYTEVMAYKHRLSHYMFHNVTLSSTYATKLTQLMISLQTAAIKLQKIKVQMLINCMCNFNIFYLCTDGGFKTGLYRIYWCRIQAHLQIIR